MLNGRTKNDRQGKHTYFGPHGKSVLDLALVHADACADLEIERLEVDTWQKAGHHALIVGLFSKAKPATRTQHSDVEVCVNNRTRPLQLTDRQFT